VDGRIICRIERNVAWAECFDPGLRPASCGCEDTGKSSMDGQQYCAVELLHNVIGLLDLILKGCIAYCVKLTFE